VINPEGYKNPIKQTETDLFNADNWSALNALADWSSPPKKAATKAEVPFFEQPQEPAAMTLQQAFHQGTSKEPAHAPKQHWQARVCIMVALEKDVA